MRVFTVYRLFVRGQYQNVEADDKDEAVKLAQNHPTRFVDYDPPMVANADIHDDGWEYVVEEPQA